MHEKKNKVHKPTKGEKNVTMVKSSHFTVGFLNPWIVILSSIQNENPEITRDKMAHKTI